jgi:hypothetical protein
MRSLNIGGVGGFLISAGMICCSMRVTPVRCVTNDPGRLQAKICRISVEMQRLSLRLSADIG